GLTHPQYLVMLALWEREPRSLADVADVLKLEPATLSPLVKRLEAAGLVTRQRSVDDERQLALRLTARGAKLRERAERVPAAVVGSRGVEVDDLVAIHAQLSALIQRLAH